MQDLLDRIALAQVASCRCGTKSPETRFHAAECPYRVLAECSSALEKLGQGCIPYEMEVDEEDRMYLDFSVPVRVKIVTQSRIRVRRTENP